MVNVAASLMSWGPFRKEFARWGRQAELFHPEDYPEYSSGGSRSTTAAHGGKRPGLANSTLSYSNQIFSGSRKREACFFFERVKNLIMKSLCFSMTSSFSDDNYKNSNRFGAPGRSQFFESEGNSTELHEATMITEATPDGTSTPRSQPSPNGRNEIMQKANNGLKKKFTEYLTILN
ncbi:unnamed protein product [Oikopleura dioica]|uniref:Uncharacterized protein n=1 Tax=Oikopleura dioica TaxID=34765 RepID=E4XPE1_OIKDI|nr:unnamed protein product [Oikopleura dioica]